LFLSGVTGPPSLSGNVFENVLLNLGEPLTFTNFRISAGKPTPTVTWYRNGVVIPAFVPRTATAADAGKYKVVAENEAGSDVHYCNVKVTAGDSFI